MAAAATGFRRAVRRQAKLRLGLDGPAGSGKSYTALRFAFAFPGARVACVEAGENGGLSLYQGSSPDGVPFDFDILEIRGNFSPTEYTLAVEEAGRLRYDVLVIDSLSHAWSGAGGALEQVGSAGFTDRDGWRKVTPQHNRMIDAILQSPCHVICTIRSKTEYLVEEDDKGRKTPRKVGMAPVQRAGMEYEFTLYGSLDHTHTLTITKSRCDSYQDAIAHKPGAAFMAPLIRWLETGEQAAPADVVRRASHEQAARIAALIAEAKLTPQQAAKGLAKHGVADPRELTAEQADEFEASLRDWLEKRKAAQAGQQPAAAGANGEGRG